MYQPYVSPPIGGGGLVLIACPHAAGEGGAQTFAGGHRREPDEHGCDERADRGADGRGGRGALGCCGGHRLSRWPA